MKRPPDIIHEVRLWIEKAEHDFLAAKHSMLLVDRGLTDIACFHAQQCAEKYLKAFLLLLGVHFPKTHDLRLLIDLVPRTAPLKLPLEEVVWLNRYSIEGRYPGDWEPIAVAEARSALKTAGAVRTAVRKHLPGPVLKGI